MLYEIMIKVRTMLLLMMIIKNKWREINRVHKFIRSLFSQRRGIEILGKHEIGFVFLFVEMLLGVLGCIDFTMSLSKSLMWHILIGWCKPKGLQSILIEFNLM